MARVQSALFPRTHCSQHRHINPKNTYPLASPTKSINGQILIDYHFQQTLPFFGCGRKSLSIPIYKMHRHLVCRAVRQVCKKSEKATVEVFWLSTRDTAHGGKCAYKHLLEGLHHACQRRFGYQFSVASKSELTQNISHFIKLPPE